MQTIISLREMTKTLILLLLLIPLEAHLIAAAPVYLMHGGLHPGVLYCHGLLHGRALYSAYNRWLLWHILLGVPLCGVIYT